MYNIPKEKYFNTWSAKSPAIMEFLPAGFSIVPGAYSYSGGTYTEFPFSEHIELCEHDADGRYCRLKCEHCGTVLEITYWKTDAWTVRCRIRAVKNGEWGLRFLPVVSFGFTGAGRVLRGQESVTMAYRSYRFAVALKDAPIRDCLAEETDYAGRRMESLGYYVPLEDAKEPRCWSLLYNLEETPSIEFAVCAANGEADGMRRANAALSADEATLGRIARQAGEWLTQEGRFGCCAEAMRDVMAWNAIADEKNGRVLTSLTRFWIDKKFGGWFLWLDDVFYHALIAAFSGDWNMAQSNLYAALESAVPAENLACLMAEFTEWVDRSQPPVFGYIVLKYYRMTHDRALVKRVFPALYDAHMWWFEHRDGNGNGVLEYGSSPDVGDGHFKRTKLAAKDEAAMDNSPMYDGARFVPEANTIDMEDVALNSLLALDGTSLAELADALGDCERAAALTAHTEAYKARIDARLWDEERGLYADRGWETGFVCPTPTSFYPLAAGIPDETRAKRLTEWIFDEDAFWTKAALPSVWAKDDAAQDNVYWRGRMWPPLNFFTYVGLRRYGLDAEAYRLAERSAETFAHAWTEEHACSENYNAFPGEGKSVDADPFYGWGALLPLMWVMEFFDTDETGFCFGSVTGEPMRLDHIRTYLGELTLSITADATELSIDGKRAFSSNAKVRFSGFGMDEHHARVTVPAREKSALVAFPLAERVIAVKVNGADAPARNQVELPAGDKATVELWY